MSVSFTQSHPAVTAESVQDLVSQGTTEKRAVAIILNRAGYTHQQGGDAMKDLFGQPVKSGGFGNLVNDGKDDVGIEREKVGSPKRPVTRELDPVQELRDTLDREREKLANAEQPVHEAQALIDRIDDTPDHVVDDRIAEIDAQIKALTTESQALVTDPKPFLDHTRETTVARRDAAVKAAADVIKVATVNVTRYEMVLDALAPADTESTS